MRGFESLGPLIRKRHKSIILGWVVIFLVSLTAVSGFLSSVNYNLTAPSGPSNMESQRAQSIINSEFPSAANTSGANSVTVVVQGTQVYSAAVRNAILTLNSTLTAESKISNYAGMTSLYSEECSWLSQMVPNLLQDEAGFQTTSAGLPSATSLPQKVAAEAAEVYSGDPAFTINGTSLGLLLSGLSVNSTSSQIEKAVFAVVSNQGVSDYPLIPTRAVERGFVGQSNGTMLFVLNFGSYPDKQTLTQISDAINASGLPALGSVYETGTAPITQEVQDAFVPSLHVTIGIALIASLLIVGILFLAPLAALVPLMIGGLSIVVAFAAIYTFLVRIGHQSISFLTPSLTALLMLGLAVDYSVLQLRRTREERAKGRPFEESVDTSVRWAGLAILTAGITVIVAYVIMALANVPLISGVGASIALGVSILLLMSLTLLPSLECAFGDKLFWPRMKKDLLTSRSAGGRSRLRSIAEGTLKRKVAIMGVVSLIALGAFATYHETPTGENLIGLFPNFPGIQGLTVATSDFGIGSVQIVVTTQTPIVSGDYLFNQTLLHEIQEVSDAAQGSTGVMSVVAPTAPLGQALDYQALQNMSAPVRAQYDSEMLSLIGRNNETALLKVSLSDSEMSSAAVSSLQVLETNVQALGLPTGTAVYYAGTTPQTSDSQSFLGGVLSQIILILGAAIYVILFVQLRSAFTPLRSIMTILSSVAISLAVLAGVFYHALGLPIVDLAPLFAIVTMLGVGIDYDIFFVTRVREEVMKGSTNDEAIKTAVEKMWMTLLALGLVLASIFSSFELTHIPLLQEIGLTVAAAILVDVGVVILFFVPAIMAIAKERNWWPSRLGDRREP